MKLDGNTILITGALPELALKFARAFVALKNTVIITGRDVAKLAKAQAQVPELKTIGSDVSRVEDINALYVKVAHDFPALNMLMNNAGVMRSINFHKDGDDLDDLTSEIDINLKGYVLAPSARGRLEADHGRPQWTRMKCQNSVSSKIVGIVDR